VVGETAPGPDDFPPHLTVKSPAGRVKRVGFSCIDNPSKKDMIPTIAPFVDAHGNPLWRDDGMSSAFSNLEQEVKDADV
jgi:hypothetical protein